MTISETTEEDEQMIQACFQSISTIIQVDQEDFKSKNKPPPPLKSKHEATQNVLLSPKKSPHSPIITPIRVMRGGDGKGDGKKRDGEMEKSVNIKVTPYKILEQRHPPMPSPKPTPARLVFEKSFLDDDWLRERVRKDPSMATVAAGLIKTSPISKHADDGSGAERRRIIHASLPNTEVTNNAKNQNMSTKSKTATGPISPKTTANPLPADYVCKLCGKAGHWLRDCQLFTPFGKPSRPPANYTCRLCGISGHWIEHCTQFQPKQYQGNDDYELSGGITNNNNNHGPFSSVPPRNYVCNLCGRPGHWIQKCSLYSPSRRRSNLR